MTVHKDRSLKLMQIPDLELVNGAVVEASDQLQHVRRRLFSTCVVSTIFYLYCFNNAGPVKSWRYITSYIPPWSNILLQVVQISSYQP